jgi:hypothetical protein
MPHGLPDFGTTTPKETIFGQVDIGELAVRLGSIVSYDRRGDVFYLENFTNGINQWTFTQAGGSGAISLSNERFLYSGISAKITVGVGAGSWSYISRDFPLPVYSRIGMELALAFDNEITVIELGMRVFDGATEHEYRVQYWTNTFDLKLLVGGVWTTIANAPCYYTDETQFHHIKLVGDFKTDSHVRLLFNENGYDISSYAITMSPSVSLQTARYEIYLYSDDALTRYAWLDHIILTQNEP